MIFGVYSLRDYKSTFMHPVLYGDDTQAIRTLLDEADQCHEFLSDCSDFGLYRIGHFDTETGLITGDDPVKIFDLANLQKGDD